jgi:uncharacterized protein HemY
LINVEKDRNNQLFQKKLLFFIFVTFTVAVIAGNFKREKDPIIEACFSQHIQKSYCELFLLFIFVTVLILLLQWL